MTGGAAADTFYFGERMTGGAAADTFAAGGHDTLTDFNAAEDDRIDLSGYESVRGLADLSLADNGDGNAVIGWGDSTITLLGVSAASLDQTSFVFAA
jgi:Ca2+-binding RTX toxin-like protein